MQIFKILIGLLLLGLAWAIVFRTGIIFRINSWLKAHVLSDEIILFSGRRVALLLLMLGAISLFSGIEHIEIHSGANSEITAHLMGQASDEFKKGHYKHVLNVCKEIVVVDPKNVQAWELLAHAQWALGDKEQSRRTIEIISLLDPDNPMVQKEPKKDRSKPSSKI